MLVAKFANLSLSILSDTVLFLSLWGTLYYINLHEFSGNLPYSFYKEYGKKAL